MSAQRVTTA